MTDLYCKELENQKDALKTADLIQIPNYITTNLKYEFYEWQKEAIENFLTSEYMRKKNKHNKRHFMFNMATGSGKTLIMAALILYYYKEGYRNFLFIVNRNNIVDKTEKNFIDDTHNKYLFAKNIIIDNKNVKIEKVDLFSANPQNNIEIKFSSIQKLHNDILNVKENINNLEDLIKRDIIILADEGHHLNSNTKKIKQYEMDFETTLGENASDKDIEKAWENTIVNKILNKDGKTYIKNKNVLIEFTATIPEDKSVIEKYKDKTIYKFDLINFLRAGYTKEINLISSSLNKEQRIIHAMLFNWYRHEIAIKNKIPNFKGVILFKSKTIEDSKKDYDFFLSLIQRIDKKDFNFLENIKNDITDSKNIYEQGLQRTEQVINYIKKNNIVYNEIINFIKSNFEEKNIIITNSKNNKAKNKEKTDEFTDNLLNNLEDKNNIIRAIFTVERLTEGWDVLNLFDIVRLAEGQNEGGNNNKPAKATVQEKQLIGRGVRYYPFKFEDKIPYKRKFDDDYNNKSGLRVLEELNYYTYDKNSRYISELKEELRKEGYIDDRKVLYSFFVKDEIKNTDFYQNTKIFYNEQKENTNKKKYSQDFIFNYLKDNPIIYQCKSFFITETDIIADSQKNKSENKINKFFEIKNYNNKYYKHIFYKAVNKLSSKEDGLFTFKILKDYFDIESFDDLLEIFKDFKIKFIDGKINFDDIESEDKLNAIILFLESMSELLVQNIFDKIGGEFEKSKLLKEFFDSPKEKLISKDKLKENNSIENEKWYMLNKCIGTSEEISFLNELVSYIKTIENKKAKDIYVLKNEEVYKIYNFKDGQGFQPDFLLFFKDKSDKYYQIFIESKGEHLIKKDEWKNEFLKEINLKYKNVITKENKNYRLTALPMFNNDNKLPFETFNNFTEEFNNIINEI